MPTLEKMLQNSDEGPESLLEKETRLSKSSETKGCDNCLNKCMDMDMDIYCAAVNKPWGQILRTKPEECGSENKLWQIDTRWRGQ